MALIHLEKQYLLTKRITLISPDGIRSREYYLDRQRPDAPVDDHSFQGGRLSRLDGAEELGDRGTAAGPRRCAARR